MKDKIRENEIQTERTKIISPLLDLTKNTAEFRRAKRDICAKLKISEKTLMRFYNSYMKNGVAGLAPRDRPGNKSKIPKQVLDRAVQLRKELPERSVTMIISNLEAEGLIKPGEVKRTTLQKYFEGCGLTARVMRRYNEDDAVGSSRYQMDSRNELWIGDMKDGPTLVINNKPYKSYCSILIDDYSRHIVHGRFYLSKSSVTIASSLRDAITKYGKPETLYFDNGPEYKNKWMKSFCSTLNIGLKFCRPYSPKSKG